MNCKGFMSVAILSVLGFLSLMALTAISYASWQKEKTNTMLHNTKAITMIQSAVLLAYEDKFDFDEKIYSFEQGEVVINKKIVAETPVLILHCKVEINGFTKKVTVTWESIGQQWKATSWDESRSL